jgi:hypothetical protein
MTLASEHTQEETEQGIPKGTNIIKLFSSVIYQFWE